MKVTVWNEFRHEQSNETVKKVYPDGMHTVIADHLSKQPGIEVRTATLDEPEHGLTDAVLNDTDVLIWWGHIAHGEVKDEIAAKVQQRVLNGMGFIGLHSAHFSKPFTRLMGSCCNLLWRVHGGEVGEVERLWVIEPGHPIMEGIGPYIELDREEMYGERFDIPAPDQLLMISWFEGGEVFRSGCCYYRGQGKIFYFRPGHETFPTFKNEEVMKVITNAVHWVCPSPQLKEPVFGLHLPKSPIPHD